MPQRETHLPRPTRGRCARYLAIGADAPARHAPDCGVDSRVDRGGERIGTRAGYTSAAGGPSIPGASDAKSHELPSAPVSSNAA
jgi:hypothetical protein